MFEHFDGWCEVRGLLLSRYHYRYGKSSVLVRPDIGCTIEMGSLRARLGRIVDHPWSGVKHVRARRDNIAHADHGRVVLLSRGVRRESRHGWELIRVVEVVGAIHFLHDQTLRGRGLSGSLCTLGVTLPRRVVADRLRLLSDWNKSRSIGVGCQIAWILRRIVIASWLLRLWHLRHDRIRLAVVSGLRVGVGLERGGVDSPFRDLRKGPRSTSLRVVRRVAHVHVLGIRVGHLRGYLMMEGLMILRSIHSLLDG
jgi:hypothetical protein